MQVRLGEAPPGEAGDLRDILTTAADGKRDSRLARDERCPVVRTGAIAGVLFASNCDLPIDVMPP
jgi:hypothetical protein